MRRNTEVAARIIFLIYISLVCAICFVKFDGGFNIPSYTILGIQQDKIIHFLMFLPFPPLAYASFYTSRKKPWNLVLFMTVVLLIGTAIAGSTEIIQGFTGYRSQDIADFRADCIGLFTGSLATLIYGVTKKKR
jgi:hypothetical protein